MKLFRFGQPGEEKPGVLYQDRHLDVSAFGQDYNEQFFSGDHILKLQDWIIEHADDAPTVSDDVRFGPPLSRPSKIICIGLNYADHAKESGMDLPEEPVVFFKATSAICGPFDQVIIPKGSVKTDWEVELAVVIGKSASYVSEGEAMNHVLGYTIHNDYSEREFQLEKGGQWVKGKSADTFAPLGPYLVTKDEISDVNNLNLWLTLNGEKLQDSNTSQLVFKVSQLVSYLSHFMTLLPGDIISTGTPAGVGLGLDPQRFLKEGDVVELGIEGLGVSKQTAISWSQK